MEATKNLPESAVNLTARLNANWISKQEMSSICSPPPMYNTTPSTNDSAEPTSTSFEGALLRNNQMLREGDGGDLDVADVVMDYLEQDSNSIGCQVILSRAHNHSEEPLCVALDAKSMCNEGTDIRSHEIQRIPAVINQCLLDAVDIPEGEHMSKALSCIRVTQYERVLVSTLDNCADTTRPRLLRYHYPYIYLNMVDRRKLLLTICDKLNECRLFKVIRWQDHMHSLGEWADPVPLNIFDWVNVSKPCLVTYESDELGTFLTTHRGLPSLEDMETRFPSYIHEDYTLASRVIQSLHARGIVPQSVTCPISTSGDNDVTSEEAVEHVQIDQGTFDRDIPTDMFSVAGDILQECFTMDCRCTDHEISQYEESLNTFYTSLEDPLHISDPMTVLHDPAPARPTCGCLCMASKFTCLALLPIILSKSVRYMLNYPRNSELRIECELTRTEVTDMLHLISKHRMSVREESMGLLKILQTCFVSQSNTAVRLWKQLCWRVGVDVDESILTDAYNTSSEYHTSSMLQHVASEDSNTSYCIWKNHRIYRKLRQCLGKDTDTDIAEFISLFLEGSWTWCPSGKDGTWYNFNGRGWVPHVYSESIRRTMSTKVVKFLENVKHSLSNKELSSILDECGNVVPDPCPDDGGGGHSGHGEESNSGTVNSSDSDSFGRRERLSKRPSAPGKRVTLGSRLNKLISGCRMVSFKNTKVKELKEVLCCPEFETMLNAAPDRLGMSDGILMVRRKQVDVKTMRMQHMCSMSTKQHLIGHKFHREHHMVLKVTKWIGQVFPNDDMNDFFWKYMASLLLSGNGDKIFMVWTGDGDNSKSMLVKLVQKALGEYCVKMPASMLSEKESHSSAANPCKAMAAHAKLIVFDEPDDTEQLKSALIKGLTGGDTRNLYEKGKQHEVTFKMLMVCNKVPPIRSMDNAIKNRFVVMPFKSMWVDNAPSTEVEQLKERRFKKDPHFEMQLNAMAPAFLWKVCTYWPKYIEESLCNLPSEVREATAEYFKECNMIELYVKESIRLHGSTCPGGRDSYPKHLIIRGTILYKHYKEWYNTLKSKYSNCMLMGSFNKELCKVVGDHRFANDHWFGVELRENDCHDPDVALNSTRAIVGRGHWGREVTARHFSESVEEVEVEAYSELTEDHGSIYSNSESEEDDEIPNLENDSVSVWGKQGHGTRMPQRKRRRMGGECTAVSNQSIVPLKVKSCSEIAKSAATSGFCSADESVS